MYGRNGILSIEHVNQSEIYDGRDNNFAFEFVITNETFLYSGPGQVGSESDRLVKPHFTSALTSAAAAANPLMTSPIENEGSYILAFMQLNPGQKIFARKMQNYPHVLEVLTFKQNVSKVAGMSETELGIETGLRGYIHIDNAKSDHDAGESFLPMPRNSELFPNVNLMSDIAQYRFGDCFLLASIQAVLSLPNGSDLIKGMMVRDGDDTIVRLFNPDTHEPIYMRVNNTTYQRNASSNPKLTLFGLRLGRQMDKQMVNHHAPWVHLLEKAYVALALEKSTERAVRPTEHAMTAPSFRQIYGNGGDVATAIQTLTGMDVVDKKIQFSHKWQFNLDVLSYCYWKFFKYSSILTDHDALLSRLDALLKTINKSEYKRIIDWLNNISKYQADNEIIIVINDCSLSDDLKNDIFDLVRRKRINVNLLSEYVSDAYYKITENDTIIKSIDVFSNYLRIGRAIDIDKLSAAQSADSNDKKVIASISDANELIEKIIGLMFAEESILEDRRCAIEIIRMTMFNIDQQHGDSLGQVVSIYDGEAGTGIYSPYSIAIFDMVMQGIRDNKVMAVSSPTKQEDIVGKGIYGRHAYTIVGAREHKNLKFIRLRNPWGHTGHVSEWDSNQAEFVSRESVEHGEFDIELSLFMRSFEKYTIGDTTKLRLIEDDQIRNERDRLERDKLIFLEQRARFSEEQQRLTAQCDIQREIESRQLAAEGLISRERAALFEREQELDRERETISQQREDIRIQTERLQSVPSSVNNRRFVRSKTTANYGYEILTTTVVTSLTLAGAGFALGWFFAPVTLGLSLPVMAGIAAGVGAIVGAAVGLTVSVISARVVANRLNAKEFVSESREAAATPLLAQRSSTGILCAAMPPSLPATAVSAAELADSMRHVFDLGDGVILTEVDENNQPFLDVSPRRSF